MVLKIISILQVLYLYLEVSNAFGQLYPTYGRDLKYYEHTWCRSSNWMVKSVDTQDNVCRCHFNITKLTDNKLSGQAIKSKCLGINMKLITVQSGLTYVDDSFFSAYPLLIGFNFTKNNLDTLELQESIIEIADASWNHISQINITQQKSMKFLNLSHNEISSINKTDFEFVTLLVLDLSYNLLISVDFFANCKTLKELYLNHNNIENITLGSLQNFPYLGYLNIAENKISSFRIGVFSNLVNLHSLDISGNNLATLDASVFLPLNSLYTLKLEGNQLQKIDYESLIDHVSSLRIVSLHDNPFYCTNLNALMKYFKSRRIVINKVGSCFLHHNFHGICCNMDEEQELVTTISPRVISQSSIFNKFSTSQPGDTEVSHILQKLESVNGLSSTIQIFQLVIMILMLVFVAFLVIFLLKRQYINFPIELR